MTWTPKGKVLEEHTPAPSVDWVPGQKNKEENLNLWIKNAAQRIYDKRIKDYIRDDLPVFLCRCGVRKKNLEAVKQEIEKLLPDGYSTKWGRSLGILVIVEDTDPTHSRCVECGKNMGFFTEFPVCGTCAPKFMGAVVKMLESPDVDPE